MKFVFKSSLFAVVAIALASLTSCNVSAVDYSYNVRLHTSLPVLRLLQGDNSYYNRITGVAYNRSLAVRLSNVQGTGGIDVTDGMLIDVPVFIYNYADNNSTDGIWTPDNVSCNVACQWVGYEMSGNSTEMVFHNYIYTSASGNLTDINFSATENRVVFSLQNTNEELYVPQVFSYRFVDSSGSAVSTDVSTISTYVQYISAQLDTIYARLNVLNDIKNNGGLTNSKLEQLKSATEDMAAQEERVADVAEDEYNKTLEDEAQASSDASGFSFNFTLPNFLSYLTPTSTNCVNTPTIDSWLNLAGDWQSPHCRVFPDSIRNALTPIVSLLITFATLMVIIRWVSGSAVDVAGDIGSIQSKGDKK